MKSQNLNPSRRKFIKGSTLLAGGLGLAGLTSDCIAKPPQLQPANELYMLGPQTGYSLHIGTLLSTMTMMRNWVLREVEGLTVEQLDFHLDKQSNSIGAMLLHLAATERYYQLNTFEGMSWGSWSQEIKDEWEVAMNLGRKARKEIQGYDLDYYLEKLAGVREVTEEEFARRDDDWIMESEDFFDNSPTNNYCKWFHVCEHESNHNGQIKFIKKRFLG